MNTHSLMLENGTVYAFELENIYIQPRKIATILAEAILVCLLCNYSMIEFFKLVASDFVRHQLQNLNIHIFLTSNNEKTANPQGKGGEGFRRYRNWCFLLSSALSALLCSALR